MVDFQVTVPESASEFIQQQIATGRYASANEFIVQLVERARISSAAKEKLADLVLEGENSGEGVEFTDEWWDQRMAELRAEAERRRSA